MFCLSESHISRIRDKPSEWFAEVYPGMHCYLAYSADPQDSRAYRMFVQDDSEHLKMRFSMNMFIEGVHVPSVRGVILFRPTASPVIYKQQIGRTLATGVQHTLLILGMINNLLD